MEYSLLVHNGFLSISAPKPKNQRDDGFLDMFKVEFSKNGQTPRQKNKFHLARTARKYVVGDLHKKCKEKSSEAYSPLGERRYSSRNTETPVRPNTHMYSHTSSKYSADSTITNPQHENSHNTHKSSLNPPRTAGSRQKNLNELSLGIVDVRHPNAILHHLYNGYYTAYLKKSQTPEPNQRVPSMASARNSVDGNSLRPSIVCPSPPKEQYTGNHIRHRLLARRKLQRRASSQKHSVSIERISPISFVSKQDSLATTTHSEPVESRKRNVALPSISPLLELRNH